MQFMQLFSHSIRMVFNNASQAARIASPLFIVMLAAYFLFGVDTFAYQNDLGFEGTDVDQSLSAQATIASLLQGLATLWVAVAWHRYILLEETANGLFPQFHGSHIWAYFVSFLYLFLLTLAVIAVAAFGGGLLMVVESVLTWLLGALVVAAGVLAICVLSARLYVVLPAAAIGKRMTLREAWTSTEGMTIPIVLAYVLIMLSVLVAGLLTGIIGAFLGLVGALIFMVFNVAVTLISLSFLTTIYGVAVQGRSID